MKPSTLLLRQIHQGFVQLGRVTSQAFRPTPKDENFLSVDNGDQISASDAWRRFNSTPGCTSAGVMGVLVEEAAQLKIEAVQDGEPYPEHCYLDFRPFPRSEIEKKAKLLASLARERGWLFGPQ